MMNETRSLIGKPLNGEKTHPLSTKAIEELRRIGAEPKPCQEINPGLKNRFLRAGQELVETFDAPSPYANNKGGVTSFARLTALGREALRQAQGAA